MSVSTQITDPMSGMTLPAPADPPSVSVVRLFSVIWARKLFILCVTAGLVCLASWVILSLPDYYLSTASVLVGSRDSVGDPLISDNKVATATDSVAIRTQVDLLKSFSLARQVVVQLNLAQAPEFARAISPRPSLVRTVTVMARQAMGRPDPPPLDEASTIDFATELLLGKMSFTNDGRSFVINIGAKTTDPRLSAEHRECLRAGLHRLHPQGEDGRHRPCQRLVRCAAIGAEGQGERRQLGRADVPHQQRSDPGPRDRAASPRITAAA